jgi:hypothetical protein
MKTITKFLFGCIAAAGLAVSASAQISLILTPANQAITTTGGTVTYNLNISGLKGSADLNGPVLGGFEITLNYNPTIALAQSVTFGNSSGTDLLNPQGGAFAYQDLTTAGQVLLMESTSDTAAALEAAQGKSFTLATITFQGVGLGTTSLTFDLTNTSLSDENALTLDMAGGATGGTLTVTAIPEPSCAAAVLGVVAVGTCLLRRRFARTKV